MKKLFYYVAIALAFMSCAKDMENHAIFVDRPTSVITYCFADAVTDSIVFRTFDSYKATSNQQWLALDAKMAQATLPNNYYNMYIVSIPFTIQSNATGSTRIANVTIHNYGKDWDQKAGVNFVQYGWLNVMHPAPDFTYAEGIARKADFLLQDTARQLTDSIVFNVQREWELSGTSDFVTPQMTQGEGGTHVVRLSITPNTTGQERTATFYLKSSEVTTPIQIKQKAEKK